MQNESTAIPTENPIPQPPQPYNNTNKKKFLVLAVILPFALLAGVLFWYFVFYQKPTSEAPGTTAKPTPSAGFGSLSPYASLCVNFQNTQAKIPCEEAVGMALMQAQGNIINVSIEPIQIPNTNSSPPTRETINIWAVDIRLNKPLFIKELEKEVRVLRIGIPVNDYEGIYKMALE